MDEKPGSTTHFGFRDVPVGETVEAFKKICDGDYDHVAEQAFFMCGGLDDVERKWEQIKKETGE